MNTAIYSQINWIAIFVSAIAYFLIGAVWYSALFQKQWISASGVNVEDPNAKKGMAAIMITSFILTLICCFGLAYIIARFNLHTWTVGLKLGLLTGICFCSTAISISYIYEKKPLPLHLINGGYHVAGNIVAAIILCLWK